MKLVPSDQQRKIFRNVKNGSGHSVFLARAGAGKTKTIELALKRVPESEDVFLTAFNKENAETLKSRIGWPRTVSTLHSYGNRALTGAFGRLQLDFKRTSNILSRMLAGRMNDTFAFKIAVEEAVSMAKNTLATTEKEIDTLLDKFAITVTVPDRLMTPGARSREVFIRYVLDVLEESKRIDGNINYDDMIWLPIARKIKVPKFTRVFIDELQDLNPAQLRLAVKACSKLGRIHAAGDDRQSLYAWSGADDTVSLFIRRLDAKTLPLTICYRCASSIIAEAQKWVPDIEAAPGAKDGSVEEVYEHDMVKQAGPGDFILSRTNAPLMQLCLKFISQGRRAMILGREIARSLTAFVKASECETIDDLESYVETWKVKEIARLKEKDKKSGKKSDVSAIQDKADCINFLCQKSTSIAKLLSTIDGMFDDKSSDIGRITLSTVHKCKGKERDRVWLLAKSFRTRSEYWKQYSPKGWWIRERLEEACSDIQEANIAYVAITRAKNQLRWVIPE